MSITKIVVSIGGMSCPHCAATIKKALSVIPDVTSVDVSLEKGTAEIHSSSPISEQDIKEAVIDADYEYKGLL
jgi:copper chaperone CopZ